MSSPISLSLGVRYQSYGDSMSMEDVQASTMGAADVRASKTGSAQRGGTSRGERGGTSRGAVMALSKEGDSTAGVPKMRASTAGAADVQLGHTHRDHDPPRDPIPTHCAGLQRKMQLRLDANGATIWRSTHPKKFSSVYPHLKYGWPIEVDGVQFVCSLCNQGICCQRPEVGESWEEKARTIGGSDNHSSSCVAKQRRNGISVDQGDAATKHLTGVRSFHNKKLAPPPLPEDAQTLRKSYPIPPFSVIRMDLDAFQKRSKQWLIHTGIDDGAGRGDNLTRRPGFKQGAGTSRFSPTLAESAYRFYAPNPHVAQRRVVALDLFCGGPTRGVVAAYSGIDYIGIDVRDEQIDANKAQMPSKLQSNPLAPTWLTGDAIDCVSLFQTGLVERGLPADLPADLIFTCPPYFDREVYSNDPRDLSCAASYADFRDKYKRVLTNAVSVLRDGHCVAIVVANVRAKSDGRMLDLTSHTKLILEEAGCLLHEDAVLIEALGSAAQEASSAVRGGKLVSVHQNLIVCTKGDAPLNAERVGEFSIHPGPVTDSAMSKRAKRQSSAGVSNGGKMAKAAQSVEVSPPTCFDIPPRAMHGFVALSNDSRLQLFQRVMREPTVEQMRLYSAAMGGVSQDQCDLVTLKDIVREAERLDEVAAGCLTDLSLVTPIEKHGDVWAKRDDLLSVNGARGSKAAAVVLLAQQAKTRDGGLVVACSRVSTMLGRVARACEHVGVPCRLHISHGELGPEEVDALDHGATLVKHNISHLRMFEPRAKADATSRDWLYVPFGIECESHLALVRRQVRDIPVGVKRIVLAVGSGVTLAGLLQGLQERETAEPHLKKVRVLGVYVNNAPEELLDRLAPAGWRGRVELKGSGTKYADAAACGERMWSPAGHTRIKLDPFYEAKAKQHMQAGDLFWLIGIRSTAVA